MTDGDIDDLLNRAGGDSPVDPALVGRITRTIGASLQPVRPLPASWILTLELLLICAAGAVASGALFGMQGIHSMSGAEIATIFAALGIVIWLGASVCATEMAPGSLRRVAPVTMLLAACAVMSAVFALLFHDYRTERFVAQGIPCLRAGLLIAIPVALACWFVLRRGVRVDPPGAALAHGALAGLAGLAMLELHCPNFETAHVMFWHTAVPAVSGVAGWLLVRLRR